MSQKCTCNYVTVSGSDSILDQLTHLRAQGIYQSGGVPEYPSIQVNKMLRGTYKALTFRVTLSITFSALENFDGPEIEGSQHSSAYTQHD